MSGWAHRSSWALSLCQRLAAEGVSIVVRLGSRFLLRLESLEERSDFAEAIRGGWLLLQCPCRDASSLDAVFLSKSELLRRQAHLVPLQLRSLDDRESSAEPLVLHDRALDDASVLVEWRAGKQSALAADLDSPVLPLEDADALACEGQSLPTGLDEDLSRIFTWQEERTMSRNLVGVVG